MAETEKAAHKLNFLARGHIAVGPGRAPVSQLLKVELGDEAKPLSAGKSFHVRAEIFVLSERCLAQLAVFGITGEILPGIMDRFRRVTGSSPQIGRAHV